MKMIVKIARMELQKMFYSPIAWLILIVFAVQTGLTLMGMINQILMVLGLGYSVSDLTIKISTIFSQIQSKLYLYIPLLTMSLLSREFNSGSIKLLYSSPISNKQIVLGKFLSMMVFGLTMLSVLFFVVLFGVFTIKDFDFPMILTGMLGLYLLICAYSAIGLFMSSLTSYQVVAAIGTFATLFIFEQVGNMWQDVEFVRDITYWLSITGRSQTFILGLICSEDLLYFILVPALFISFTIFRLKGIREKTPKYVSFARYVGAFMIVAMLGYVSTIPSLMKYHDATHTNRNTLTQNSQNVISKLKGKITITNYVNIFDDQTFKLGSPSSQKFDMNRYNQYLRFYPNIKFKYKYYYALPVDENALKSHQFRYKELTQEEALEKACDIYEVNSKKFKPGRDYLNEIDLESELNSYIKEIKNEDGKISYLRTYKDPFKIPLEPQITAAFKKLVMELPLVGFVTGHEERDLDGFGSRGYYALTKEKSYRHSLINNGFDFTECNLNFPIDKKIDILIIAGSKTMFSDEELKNLDNYIERGGNLIIAADRKRQDAMNPLVERFGVKFMEGQVVEYNEGYTQDLVTGVVTPAGKKIAYQFEEIAQRGGCVSMEGVLGISYENTGDFKAIPVLVSDTMKNMPVSNDPEFLKQLKTVQGSRKEDSKKDILKDASMILNMLEQNQKHQLQENTTKKEYIGSWNELQTTDFIDDVAKYDPKKGEIGGPVTMALALTRKVGDKEQRIMILGDADCLSNGEFSRKRNGIMSENFRMANGIFFWLSENEAPLDVRRPATTDNELYIKKSDKPFLSALYKIIIPTLFALAFLLIWLRRKGR